MSKIIGYKFIGTVNGLQQFEPIVEGEEDLTKQIIDAWKKRVEEDLKVKETWQERFKKMQNGI